MRTALLAALLLSAPAWADEDGFVSVQRGHALAVAGDCIACHTAPNGAAYSGGRGITTPFGTVNSANLTPDIETGIATWSKDDFWQALHNGIRPDGTHLYPVFPYTHYTKITRDDSDAIYAFFRTLPATHRAVDRDTLPFPFDIRASMTAWNAAFFSPGVFQPDPARSEAYNRGAYLVEGLGHCGVCHTPMNMAGANKASEELEGNSLGDWYAPNITADSRIGVGGWSADQIVEYLRTGHNEVAAASGPMGEVVAYSTALMPETDLRAIATYLKERGASAPATPTPVPASDPAMAAGAAIYADTCSACHGPNGRGVDRLFPRLAGAPGIQQPDATSLIRAVLAGAKSAVTPAALTGPAMPALGWRLTDNQVASVVTFIRNSWGNAAPPVAAGDVAAVRKAVTSP